jgi:hypothetical protein
MSNAEPIAVGSDTGVDAWLAERNRVPPPALYRLFSVSLSLPAWEMTFFACFETGGGAGVLLLRDPPVELGLPEPPLCLPPPEPPFDRHSL